MSINPSRVSLHIEVETARDLLTEISGLCQGDPMRPTPTKLQVLDIPAGLRFQIHGDFVVDRTTGLVWSRENVPGGRLTWKAAQEACAKITLGGYSDWRLPTIAELLTLVDYQRSEPAIDPVFTCDLAPYWTSTPAASSPGDCAWYVNFNGGGSSWCNQSSECFVRAVRASQS